MTILYRSGSLGLLGPFLSWERAGGTPKPRDGSDAQWISIGRQGLALLWSVASTGGTFPQIKVENRGRTPPGKLGITHS